METEVDRDLLDLLVGMGFDREAVVSALLVTNNASMDAALDYLQSYCLPASGQPPPSNEDNKNQPDAQEVIVHFF